MTNTGVQNEEGRWPVRMVRCSGSPSGIENRDVRDHGRPDERGRGAVRLASAPATRRGEEPLVSFPAARFGPKTGRLRTGSWRIDRRAAIPPSLFLTGRRWTGEVRNRT